MENQTNSNTDNTTNCNSRRWYDRDPVLSKAMKTLKNTDDNLQIQISLNLIKIVLEHKIEQQELSSIEDILSSMHDASNYDENKNNRWYDLNETVRSAILMLENCPADLQKKIAKDMAEVVTRIIQDQD